MNSPIDVAKFVAEIIWNETLISVGFTENTSANLMDMTQVVIDNIVIPENQDQAYKLTTTLDRFLKEQHR